MGAEKEEEEKKGECMEKRERWMLEEDERMKKGRDEEKVEKGSMSVIGEGEESMGLEKKEEEKERRGHGEVGKGGS